MSHDDFFIHDDLDRFRSVFHGPYLIYPLLFDKNQVFHGSPIGLKAAADSSLGIYRSPGISPEYWDGFFRDWIDVLKRSGHRVIVIYFRPFAGGERFAFSDIQKHLQQSRRGDLMVDANKCSLKKLADLHERYIKIMLKMKRELKQSMQFYHVEYQDMDDAVDALRHEKFLP